MCKTRSSAMIFSQRNPQNRTPSFPRTTTTDSMSYPPHGLPPSCSSSAAREGANLSKGSSSPLYSLSAVFECLPDPPILYSFSEISPHLSPSSSSWRCSLRGKDAVVFRRPMRSTVDIRSCLAALGKSKHSRIALLLGACLHGDIHIYIAYEYIRGIPLSRALRGSINPEFTPLSSWLSRFQIATDIADALDYIHYHSGASSVHNRLTSTSVIVTDDLRAKICYFGIADLIGEMESANTERRIDGKKGYIAPEVIAGGCVTQQCDVYAFGVVLLELISGDELVKYTLDKRTKELRRVSLIETATEAVNYEGENVELRKWVDRRLKDSFPLDVAGKSVRLALQCLATDPSVRPEMEWVTAKVSKMFLESKAWARSMGLPTDISVSVNPR